jgi:hypothetical protein
MREFWAGNTGDMNELLKGDETGRVTVPFEANVLLVNQAEADGYLAGLEAVAAEAGRSLHLR